jgi:hypothetical protein
MKLQWLVYGELRHEERHSQHKERKVVVKCKKRPTFGEAMRKLKKMGWDVRSLYSIEPYHDETEENIL